MPTTQSLNFNESANQELIKESQKLYEKI